ncbi:YhgE/Pip domain-containing protein [Hoyosella rhizosphaerae]|uniref:Membrane protein n=1 Tax=Hoyosella rhizosphaerae TaxID=1755582 RepID=A0A916XDE5_9ACTN|nr:YhgE/Pip domain-containing protein [Hoyosella rhizosphaerae]MBN4927692.1 YhgE/Pip domain-containing protein [Hoyosella rhizosphaerae]GGC62426.1 membrane protein [Hoyosella rhizosphaerae]
MVAALSFGTELKRFSRETLPRLAIVAIIFLPLLYGAMYLWAFWNPLGKVDKMPVAIVNSDRGATVDGFTVRFGEQVTRELIQRGDLGWERVSQAEAERGVNAGDYYFAVEFPEDFSDALTSPAGDDPQKAVINVTYNDATNAIGTTIAQTAMAYILNVMSDTIGAESVDQVLIALQDVRGGLVQAADGGQQLADGTGVLLDGVTQLDSGTQLLAQNLGEARDGATALAAGTDQLANGLTQLTDGIVPLADGLVELQGGAQQLGAGADQISGAINQLVAQLNILAEQQAIITGKITAKAELVRTIPHPIAHDVARDLDNLRAEIDRQGFGPGTQSQLQQLRDGAAQLAFQLNDPQSPFRVGLAIAADGGGQLTAGATQLRDGATEINNGAQALAMGLGQLADGGGVLATSFGQLTDGVSQLDGGANLLATELRAGSQQIPAWDEQQRRAQAEVLGGPLSLDQQHVAFAPNFGTGVAPFFISLAMFIGGFIVWMLMRPLQTRPLAAALGGFRTVLASYWPAMLVSVAQALVTFAVVRYAIGMEPANSAGMLAFLVLVGLSFLAFIQTIFVLLGSSTARVAVLALLMINLVSAGGLYPPETTGRLFEVIHQFVPMKYSVDGLRQLIIGGADGRLWTAVAVLIGLLVVSIAVSALSARKQQEWSMKRLHPPIPA